MTVLPFVIDKHKRLYLLTQKGYCITAPRVLSELQAAQKEKQASQAHGLSQDEVNSHLAKMEEHISNACRHGDTLGKHSQLPFQCVPHLIQVKEHLQVWWTTLTRSGLNWVMNPMGKRILELLNCMLTCLQAMRFARNK